MKLNLAARAGRWSAAHWKTATFGWLAFVIVAVVIGGAVGTKQLGDTEATPGESGPTARILDEDFDHPAEEIVLVESETLTTESPAFRRAVEDVVAPRHGDRRHADVRSPLEPANADQISADGSSAIVSSTSAAIPDTASDRIEPVVAAVDEGEGGASRTLRSAASARRRRTDEITESVGKDLERAGLLSLPVTIVVLVVAFGALVAAGIPLLLALTGVIATMGLLALPSQVWPVDENVSAVVLLIGLAVGVDYSLFYLKREREERAAGRTERAALEAAAATSGRAVLISGLTVMIAMAGMFLTGDKTFGSFAMATIMVVAIAVLGSLTVLPALLSRLGDASTASRAVPPPAAAAARRPGLGLDARPRSAPAAVSRRRLGRRRWSRSPCPRSG